jgi:hypothetical protein
LAQSFSGTEHRSFRLPARELKFDTGFAPWQSRRGQLWVILSSSAIEAKFRSQFSEISLIQPDGTGQKPNVPASCGKSDATKQPRRP